MATTTYLPSSGRKISGSGLKVKIRRKIRSSSLALPRCLGLKLATIQLRRWLAGPAAGRRPGRWHGRQSLCLLLRRPRQHTPHDQGRLTRLRPLVATRPVEPHHLVPRRRAVALQERHPGLPSPPAPGHRERGQPVACASRQERRQHDPQHHPNPGPAPAGGPQPYPLLTLRLDAAH